VSTRAFSPSSRTLARAVASPRLGHRRPLAPWGGSRAGSLTQSTRPTWHVDMDRGPPISL
jgi:hypothetical protein